jgi:cyclophilin family peptidyl-prolyl cis-trans isomerase
MRTSLIVRRAVCRVLLASASRWGTLLTRAATTVVLLSTATSHVLHAQARVLSQSDSVLVGRILLAEDARNASDPSIAAGRSHTDARVRAIAERAAERIRDPQFARRDSLPAVTPNPAPPVYADPAWRLRLRGLTAQRNNCGALRTALNDSVWPVRFRAMALLSAPCASDAGTLALLQQWVDEVPADASRRSAGNVSWHGAAHALVAMARIAPNEARSRVSKLASHSQPELREYVARAAAQLSDTVTLRVFVRDANANVRALAIESLQKLVGHADDERYLAAIDDTAAQVVRAAALALAGSPRADVAARANAAHARWVSRADASARDVRLALLAAARRDSSEDVAAPRFTSLPSRAVPLVLGEVIHVRVTMDAASGGGSFVVRMRGDAAPMMASRVLDLVDAKYYDGLKWHRVEHDFVVQGGGPGANEYVGLSTFLRDELGTVPHVRGTVGMSTRGHDTGDAQWFFNVRDNLRLNRDYTVFAEVTEGIEVVDGILEGDRIATMRVERR